MPPPSLPHPHCSHPGRPLRFHFNHYNGLMDANEKQCHIADSDTAQKTRRYATAPPHSMGVASFSAAGTSAALPPFCCCSSYFSRW